MDGHMVADDLLPTQGHALGLCCSVWLKMQPLGKLAPLCLRSSQPPAQRSWGTLC